MSTYRRIALTLVLSLTLFFLFFGGPKRILSKDLLHSSVVDPDLETAKEESTGSTLKESHQASTEHAAEKQDQKLKDLETERNVLDKQLQGLRRLPSDASVRTQLAYQFPYNAASRFPAYIWQTWKQSQEDPDFDKRFRSSVRSWTQSNPGFAHEVMSDDMAHAIIQHLYMNVPKVIEAYQSLPENILRADFFRYLILLARGGTYSDVDTEALKPVPHWIPESMDPYTIGLIVGIEADPDREDWAEWYARRIQFCQWTIQSKPGHPVLRNIVAKITDETLRRKTTNTLPLPPTKERGSQIMNWTGPGIWTDSVFEYFNDGLKPGMDSPITWQNFTGLQDQRQVSDVMVLPITSFSPGVATMGSQSVSHPLAFVRHRFVGSWKPKNEQMR